MTFATIGTPVYILGKDAGGNIGWVAVQTFTCP
jgi:hypothetical protein